MRNEAICAARSAWYSFYEPLRLRWERQQWKPKLNPLVSVIIPTHNRCSLLLIRALRTVRAQTYTNLEIIVAAHGCTDYTIDRITGFDARLKVIDVPRVVRYPDTPENHWYAGPVDPLNAALGACTGQWIARLDDDDYWSIDHIKRLLEFARAGEYEFVSSAHETHEGRVRPYNTEPAGVTYLPLIGGCQTWLYRSYLKFMRYNPDCWRKSWNRVNDTDLQDRMVRAGVRMGYLDRVTATVLPRPGETDVGLKAYQSKRTAA